MKTKPAIAAFIMLCGSGCMTTTNTYTRDIVYRDGSYYSPADEQYGDYYYEPEPDYSYYADDYYYGFNSGYYGRHDSYRCRFSYRYDRYCDSGWGSSFLNFGGLTIIFGSSHYYDYGYRYPGYYNSGYGYHGYPYFGWYTPRPRPRNHDPIPMPKPTRPFNQAQDDSVSNAPGIRVSGEPVWVSSTKPGQIDQEPVEPAIQLDDEQSRNPQTRVREPRPYARPEIWRNSREENSGVQDDIRSRTKPALIVAEDDGYPALEKPVRQNRRPQPYLRDVGNQRERQPATIYSNTDTGPQERIQRDNRQERPAPRERIERIERAEQRNDRPVRASRQESNDDDNGVD